MDLFVNIDVPDLAAAERFYVQAFGLKPTRRFGDGGLELTGWPVRLYLLQKAAGTAGAAMTKSPRPDLILTEYVRMAGLWCEV